MNILFVDDMESRLKTFRSILDRLHIPYYIRFRTSPEVTTTQDFEWADLAMLDHDMCESHYGELPCPKSKAPQCKCQTGEDLAKRISGMVKEMRPALTVVHTLNPSGGANMMDVLLGAGWKVAQFPFIQLDGVAVGNIQNIVNHLIPMYSESKKRKRDEKCDI